MIVLAEPVVDDVFSPRVYARDSPVLRKKHFGSRVSTTLESLGRDPAALGVEE